MGLSRNLVKAYAEQFVLLVLVFNPTACTQEQVLSDDSNGDANSGTAVAVAGFGSAKHFMPLPHTVVGAHCTWQLRLNTVPTRIPETITEVLCHAPGDNCGGSQYYTCKQMKAKMLVAHVEPVAMSLSGRDTTEYVVREPRNITINIGCSCVYREPVLLHQFYPSPQEKRSISPAKTARKPYWSFGSMDRGGGHN